MSAEGEAFVEKHSPYTGIVYAIHLRFGHLENNTRGHRLWMADKNVAKLCRCDVKTIRRAKKRMIDDGFLELLQPPSHHSPAVYRFLFPKSGVDVSMDDDDVLGGHFVPESGHPVPAEWTSGDSSPLIGIKDESKKLKSVPDTLTMGQAKTLCALLNERVTQNGFKAFTEGPNALGAMERLLRIDKRHYEEILRVLEWSQRNEFWLTNIRSPQKFRDKFDTLYGQMNQKNGRNAAERFINGGD